MSPNGPLRRIAVLPGDGIGPEVTAEAAACLELVASEFFHPFRFETHRIGGVALDACGDPLPAETLDACRAADAVLLGAVGTPAHDAQPRDRKPETGLLRLRAGLGCYANLRPVAVPEALVPASPLKADVVRGADLLIVRELAGGLYYGAPRELTAERGLNTLAYTRDEVARVARVAFEAARGRRRKVTSVDKANVLESSQLWRAVVGEVAKDFPDVRLDHQYVDSMAMALVTRPTAFDVVLTENLFGDILSDEAAVLPGSLGLLPSASLGDGPGLFEPVHGSAPDLAGKGVANPGGAIASAALLLRHAFGLEREARLLEEALASVLAEGVGTPDLALPRAVGTAEFGARVRRSFSELA
ncbi:MAG: 3-isopropylmalate dehydrogenase [Holophagaceae bacterium]